MSQRIHVISANGGKYPGDVEHSSPGASVIYPLLLRTLRTWSLYRCSQPNRIKSANQIELLNSSPSFIGHLPPAKHSHSPPTFRHNQSWQPTGPTQPIKIKTKNDSVPSHRLYIQGAASLLELHSVPIHQSKPINATDRIGPNQPIKSHETCYLQFLRMMSFISHRQGAMSWCSGSLRQRGLM